MAVVIRVACILPRFNKALVGTCRVDLGTESKGRVGDFGVEGNLLDVLGHEVFVPQTALVQSAIRMTGVDGPKGPVVVVDAMVHAGDTIRKRSDKALHSSWQVGRWGKPTKQGRVDPDVETFLPGEADVDLAGVH